MLDDNFSDNVYYMYIFITSICMSRLRIIYDIFLMSLELFIYIIKKKKSKKKREEKD